MNRATEVEILSSTLPEPTKGFMRASLIAQKAGRLDSAARLANAQFLKHPTLAWPVLLLALDDAELRLGGAVEIGTPTSRFAASAENPLFEERWGEFGCVVWPEEHRAKLQVVRGRNEIELRTEAHSSKGMSEALAVLTKSLEGYFGVRVLRVAKSAFGSGPKE